MDLVGFEYGTLDSLWNGGGNGVDNENFSDSYGTMEFTGKDHVRLCAMDELGQEMGCVLVYHSTNPLGGRSLVQPSTERFFVAFPNPAKDELRIEFRNGHRPSVSARMRLHTIRGRLVRSWAGNRIRDRMSIDLRSLGTGGYTLSFTDEGATDTRTVVVGR